MISDMKAKDYDLKSMSNFDLKFLYQKSENRFELSELNSWKERRKLQESIKTELRMRKN